MSSLSPFGVAPEATRGELTGCARRLPRVGAMSDARGRPPTADGAAAARARGGPHRDPRQSDRLLDPPARRRRPRRPSVCSTPGVEQAADTLRALIEAVGGAPARPRSGEPTGRHTDADAADHLTSSTEQRCPGRWSSMSVPSRRPRILSRVGGGLLAAAQGGSPTSSPSLGGSASRPGDGHRHGRDRRPSGTCSSGRPPSSTGRAAAAAPGRTTLAEARGRRRAELRARPWPRRPRIDGQPGSSSRGAAPRPPRLAPSSASRGSGSANLATRSAPA